MKNLYKIFRYIFPYKWLVASSVVFNILGAIASLFSLTMVMPFLGLLFGTTPLLETQPEFSLTADGIKETFYYHVSLIINEFGRNTALLAIIGLVVVTAFLKNLFAYLSMWTLAPIRNGVVKDIRNALFIKILYLPLRFFSDEKKGDVISKMTNDVKEIEVSIIRSLEMFFRDPFIIIVHISMLIILSPQLTLFVLVILPLAGALIGRLGKSLRKTSFRGQRKMGALLSIIEETLGGLRIIKAFNAEGKMNERFRSVNSFYTLLMIKMWRRRDLASPLSEFLGTIVIAMVLLFGGKLVLSGVGKLSPEGLIGYVAIFYMIVNPVKSISNAYFNVLKGMASVDRIDSLLNAEISIKNKPNAMHVKTFEDKIEYRNVNFRYGSDYVLKDINLTIEKGETVALVGQSGSGKSTFVDLLPRFYDLEEGEILIDGVNIKDFNIQSLRGLMGNVNQEPILFNDSIFNNISFGIEGATEKEVINAAKIANAHEFIIATKNGYYTNIGDRGGKLSGGQRQRLSIARAILKNPPIMILDEATSALDTKSERLVQQAIDNLMKDRTSIVIAHRLSTIKKADLICVLHEGRIVETGKHKELLSKEGVYAKLYQLQM